MKKLSIILITLLTISNLYSAGNRNRSVRVTSNSELKLLHELALGFRTVKTRGRYNATRLRKVSVNMDTRIKALKELGKRKNVKSVTTICSVITEGLGTVYSQSGRQAGRENRNPAANINIRITALKTIRNYLNVNLSQNNVNKIKYSFKTVLFEGIDTRERTSACTNIGLFRKLYSIKEKKFYNGYFAKEIYKIIKRSKYRLVYAMIKTTDRLNHKSGVNFLNKAIRRLRGRIKNYALRVRQRIISQ